MDHLFRRGFFLLLVFLITLAFIGLINDFLLALFWAAVLAVIFFNPYRRIRILLRGRDNVAAGLTTLLILFTVVIPVMLVILALVNESIQLYERIRTGDLNIAELISWLDQQLPLAEDFLGRFGFSLNELKEDLSQAAVSLTQAIANRALNYTQNAITLVIEFFLVLYLLFFFLRDGRAIKNSLIKALPLGNRRERLLMSRFASVARATLKGTLIVAVVQGSIGGLLFWAVGIKSALFWGVLMTLFSLLPVGGSGLVWGPAAIVLFIQGDIVRGLILVVVGSLIIGLVDNLLRPIVVGRDTKMPDYVVLLATLGGLVWFGLSGFILGPVIAAFFITCWDIVGKEYGGDRV